MGALGEGAPGREGSRHRDLKLGVRPAHLKSVQEMLWMRAGEGPERKAAGPGSREGPGCRGPCSREGSQLSPGGL